jgi:hypothetical protein
MYSKACDSKIDYPWLNICDSDGMENVSSVTSSVTTDYTVPKKLRRWRITQPLTQPSWSAWPYPNRTVARILSASLERLSPKGCNSKCSHPRQRPSGTCIIRDRRVQEVYNSFSIYTDLKFIVYFYNDTSNTVIQHSRTYTIYEQVGIDCL